MFNHRIMSDYISNLSEVGTYGCDPMSIGELTDEFEPFPLGDEEFEGLISI